MALDRQSIEKKDFPVGRRGYEPAAVDAHLTAISEEVEELKRAARKRTESLASSSSEQVRAIIDAAENSAAEIHRLAEDDAREIRADANSEAKSTRDRATTEAREYIDKVGTATNELLARIDAMENELGSVFESLKAGASRIDADLRSLDANLGEVREAVAPARFEAEPAPAAVQAAAADERIDPEVHDAAELYGVDAGEVAAAAAAADAGVDSAAPPDTGSRSVAPPTAGATVHRDPTGGAGEDVEGARLIALNMALDGTSREETDRYLAQNFKLSDRAALLDEVYESVQG
ncbi:MAG TPA: DivIVA domain-containing protein [Solirubrobacteraceae bacterium]|nr:DivIVA domain-containing protein [Solirubrobacteraceae bacterium]